MTALSVFQIPGQDVVWREVLPGGPSALEGVQSVTAKAATSGARIYRRSRILTEVGGAFGWRMTCSELKWLYDWHFVRGNNLINAHAVFYSIRERRAWESEPDIGVHNVWWPYFHLVARYAKRLSWLLSNGRHVCELAILGDGNNLPWEAAKILYQNQIDFLYLDDFAVSGSRPNVGSLEIGDHYYSTVIVEGAPALSDAAREKLVQFQKGGGTVIDFEGEAHLLEALSAALARDIRMEPSNRDLRFIHIQKEGLHFYLLVNEGEKPIQGDLIIRERGAVEFWNPWNGERESCNAVETSEGLSVRLALGHRESLVLVVDPDGTFIPSAHPEPIRTAVPLVEAWKVSTDDDKPVDVPALTDWAQHAGFELFSGTLVYRISFEPPTGCDDLSIDLGQVGDIAEVFLDGKSRGVRMWAPYRFHLGRRPTSDSVQLEVHVTNSMANEYNGAQMPSGLIGPVRLLTAVI